MLKLLDIIHQDCFFCLKVSDDCDTLNKEEAVLLNQGYVAYR